MSKLNPSVVEGVFGIPTNLREDTIKVVSEKYVDSPAEAEKAINKEPPKMTIGRARRLLNQGIHTHDDVEYIHVIYATDDTEDVHDTPHLEIDGDALQELVDNATYDLGERVFD